MLVPVTLFEIDSDSENYYSVLFMSATLNILICSFYVKLDFRFPALEKKDSPFISFVRYIPYSTFAFSTVPVAIVSSVSEILMAYSNIFSGINRISILGVYVIQIIIPIWRYQELYPRIFMEWIINFMIKFIE